MSVSFNRSPHPDRELEKMTASFKQEPSETNLNKILSFVDSNLSHLSKNALETFRMNFEKVYPRHFAKEKTESSSAIREASARIEGLINKKKLLIQKDKILPSKPIDIPNRLTIGSNRPIPISSSKKSKPSLEELQTKVALGDRDALFAMGEVYESQGRTRMAIELYHDSAAKNCPEAHLKLVNLAINEWMKEGSNLNKEEAGKLIFSVHREKCPELIAPLRNNLFSAYAIAECYHHGIGVKKDEDMAIKILLLIQESSSHNSVLNDAADVLIREILEEDQLKYKQA